MSRRATAVFALLAAAGLFLYLWPAVRAPVVLWSDSEVDLEWARQGVGIVSPVPPVAPGEEPPAHPAKPAYLLFLRAVTAIAPVGGGPRAIVVVQSLLLWLSIVATSFFVARRRGVAAGIAVLVLLHSCLRIRDTASAVMPEALAGALLLPIAALLLEPLRPGGAAVLGTAICFLFWVRPNVGAAALLLAIGAAVDRKSRRALAALAAGFVLLFAPVWFVTRPESDRTALRGLARAFLVGSVEYYRLESLPASFRGATAKAVEEAELRDAAREWRATLARSGPDARRELAWRALHGLFGTEFYDARWSTTYWWLTESSRAATPIAILAAAVLLVRRSPAGAGLLVLLVLQSLLLGSLPRYVLPFLPALFLFTVIAAREPVHRRTRERFAMVAAFAFSIALIGSQPHLLDREWGRIESPGVSIRQRIPKGALPDRAPATLHARIAPALRISSAHLEVRGPGDRLLATSRQGDRGAAIRVPLPAEVLDANRREAIELRFVATGEYGANDFLLFPVIPRPWRSPARREGSEWLSPTTGVRGGSLDWWAHEGVE